jgi:hypothetical protein
METDAIQGAPRCFFERDTTTAEAAVLDGIGACEDVSHRSLLIAARRSAVPAAEVRDE